MATKYKISYKNHFTTEIVRKNFASAERSATALLILPAIYCQFAVFSQNSRSQGVRMINDAQQLWQVWKK